MNVRTKKYVQLVVTTFYFFLDGNRKSFFCVVNKVNCQIVKKAMCRKASTVTTIIPARDPSNNHTRKHFRDGRGQRPLNTEATIWLLRGCALFFCGLTQLTITYLYCTQVYLGGCKISWELRTWKLLEANTLLTKL